MWQVSKGILVGLGIAGFGAMLYQFASGVWVLLNLIPLDVLIYAASFVLCLMWVAYARWLWRYIRKTVRRERKPRESGKKDYPRKQVIAVLSPMEQLERNVDEHRASGSGSVAGNLIGLDAIDEYLEGDI